MQLIALIFGSVFAVIVGAYWLFVVLPASTLRPGGRTRRGIVHAANPHAGEVSLGKHAAVGVARLRDRGDRVRCLASLEKLVARASVCAMS